MTPRVWAKLRTEQPAIPGYTCPLLDRIKARLEATDNDVAVVRAQIMGSRLKAKDTINDDLLAIDATLATARLLVEEVRQMNEALRQSGRYWYGIAKRLAQPTTEA